MIFGAGEGGVWKYTYLHDTNYDCPLHLSLETGLNYSCSNIICWIPEVHVLKENPMWDPLSNFRVSEMTAYDELLTKNPSPVCCNWRFSCVVAATGDVATGAADVTASADVSWVWQHGSKLWSSTIVNKLTNVLVWLKPEREETMINLWKMLLRLQKVGNHCFKCNKSQHLSSFIYKML